MSRFKAFLALCMAIMVSVTSMGMTVSSHACSESGYNKAGIGFQESCCKLPTGEGIWSVPCCKLSVQHVKLATVRAELSQQTVQVPVLNCPAVEPLQPLPGLPEAVGTASTWSNDPPDGTPRGFGRDIHRHFCLYRI